MAERVQSRRVWWARQAESGRAVGRIPVADVSPPVADGRLAVVLPGEQPATLLPWYERLGAEVLSDLAFPWSERLPGWSVRFLPGRDRLLGGTWTYEKRIEIYVRNDQPRQDVAFTVAHELGHAVDVALLGEGDRQAWKQQRGLEESVPWWVESGASDLASGSGDWAEAFAVWLVGGVSHSRVACQPTPADLALVARLSQNRPALAA